MRVLLDTDVLIDVALDRAPYADAAAAVLDSLERRPGMGTIAWHSASNFYYLVAPRRGKGGARQFLLELCRFIDIAPTTTESLRYAAQLEMKDFEDAMQVAAAIQVQAEILITRNVKDYSKAPVRALRPSEALLEILHPSRKLH